MPLNFTQFLIRCYAVLLCLICVATFLVRFMGLLYGCDPSNINMSIAVCMCHPACFDIDCPVGVLHAGRWAFLYARAPARIDRQTSDRCFHFCPIYIIAVELRKFRPGGLTCEWSLVGCALR